MNVAARIVMKDGRREGSRRRAERAGRAFTVRRLSRFVRRLSPLGEVGRTLTAGVVAAWVVLNTAYTLYYTYLYYGDEETSCSLKFPGDKEPGMLDFAFAIGTSFVTSDVQVTSRAARGADLVHTVFSFAYNTVLIAVVVNVVSRAPRLDKATGRSDRHDRERQRAVAHAGLRGS
jgi:hypothetical protein